MKTITKIKLPDGSTYKIFVPDTNKKLDLEISERKNADINLKNSLTDSFTQESASINSKIQTILNQLNNDVVSLEQFNILTTQLTELNTQFEKLESASDVADVVGTKADLDAYNTILLTNKAIIKVLHDETNQEATTYYRFDRKLNTFEFLSKIGPFYTQSEINIKENALRSEIAVAKAELSSKLDAQKSELANEAATRQAADQEHTNSITKHTEEIEAIKSSISDLSDTEKNDIAQIKTEINNLDTTVQQNKTDLISSLNNNVDLLNKQITSSATDLNLKISANKSALEATDKKLTQNILEISQIHDSYKTATDAELQEINKNIVSNTNKIDSNNELIVGLDTKLSTKLPKISSHNKIYGTDSLGNQKNIDYSDSAVGNAVALRAENGCLQASAPILDNDVVTKKYFEENPSKLNPATKGSLGGIIVGDEFDITSDGKLTLYKEIGITSFYNNVNSVPFGKVINTVTLNWNTNKIPNTVSIDGVTISPSTSKSAVLSGLNITSNKTFTLKVTDARTYKTANTSIVYKNYRLWGIGAEFDESKMSKELSTSKTKTFTVNAGPIDYIFYAFPKRFGVPAFKVGGFEGGFTQVKTYSWDNGYGYKEDYVVYKSTNKNLGNTTVEVK